MGSAFSDCRRRCNLRIGLSSEKMDQVRKAQSPRARDPKRSDRGRPSCRFGAVVPGLPPLPLASSLLRLSTPYLSKPPPPVVRDDGCHGGDRRPPRSPTDCARAPRASWPLPPPLASLSSCLRGRLSSRRGATDPSRSRRNTTHWLENRGTIPAVEISVDIVRQD
jgi:hypothetical protein